MSLIIDRLNQEQMVERMESSLNRLRARLEWNGKFGGEPSVDPIPGRPEVNNTCPATPKFSCDIQLHLDTVDTLVALGIKRTLAVELDIDAKGSSVGDRVAFALRNAKFTK